MKARIVGIGLLLLMLSSVQAGNRNTYPLPEDRGSAGILAALEKLPVYARVLEITAHPDDENAATLTWLARRFHADTALFCLTRGEGGQNILGSEKYEALGLVRTGELSEACKRYGVELYFGAAIDFGFSKTSEETLRQWGREETLGDMVRFIRRWRPSVIISRFGGVAADGHGHHQAAGILAREAFHAAGDRVRFPEQLAGGLRIWQAKKFYVSSAPFPDGAAAQSKEETVRIPTGAWDPVLGRSTREIAAEGYSQHRTQGVGATFAFPGNAYEYFRLEGSSAKISATPGKEAGFFDSIDTSLLSILELAGSEKSAVPFLAADLRAAQQAALDALASFTPSAPANSAGAVALGIETLRRSMQMTKEASITAATRDLLLDALGTKLDDFEHALNATLGVSLLATTDELTGVPGERRIIQVALDNRGSEAIVLEKAGIEAYGKEIPAKAGAPSGRLAPGASMKLDWSVDIPQGAPASEPHWHRDGADRARYRNHRRHRNNAEFSPFGEAEIKAHASYRYHNAVAHLRTNVVAPAGDPLRGADFDDVQTVPTLSLTVQPGNAIVPIGAADRERSFRISIANNRKGEISGTLRLASDSDWSVTPEQAKFRLTRKGESAVFSFVVKVHNDAKPGAHAIHAVAHAEGEEFRTGCQAISYPENWTRRLCTPADASITLFPIELAPHLKVGYIPGAGDDIPAALEQLGIEVTTLTGNDLALGELDRFSTIITGVRAYNVNEELKANNRRLLEYVNHGGTLVVQYVRPGERPAPGKNGVPFTFGPYPMTVSDSARITVEDSPVEILAPQHPALMGPNLITDADFEGWVQERGSYFMDAWDERYQPLLSGADPGETPLRGGMLYAAYGKGRYFYTGYSWFRQLPAGVPGALRIFANILSMGRTR